MNTSIKRQSGAPAPELERPSPVVFLGVKGSPWSGMLLNVAVEDMLVHVAREGERLIRQWARAGLVLPDASFALALLDPTKSSRRPRGRSVSSVPDETPVERVFGVILFGDPTLAEAHLEGAIGAADIVYRHRESSADVITYHSYKLGPHDTTCMGGVEYEGAIAGGNGLSDELNAELSKILLRLMLSLVHARQESIFNRWMSLRWWNGTNAPDGRYKCPLDATRWRRRSVTS